MRMLGLGGLLMCIGCDDHLFGESGGDVVIPQTSGFDGVREIVEQECLNCHGTQTAFGDLDLETDLHAATVGVVGQYAIPIVLAGEPDDSLLYLKVTDSQPAGVGSDMPPNSGGLDVGLTDLIRDWIADGAPAE